MKVTDNYFFKYYVDLTNITNKNLLKTKLKKHGLVTFSGINNREEILDLAQSLGSIYKHRDSESDGATVISSTNEDKDLKKGYQGFSTEGLKLHTDRSGVQEPPELIILYCSKMSLKGGETVLVDGKEVYEYLLHEDPVMLEKLSTKESVVFGGSQTPFLGSIFNKMPSGDVYIRFRYDNLGYYCSDLIDLMPRFLEIVSRHSINFRLQESQGYIIQNGRWLHGRKAFVGNREVIRLLVNTPSNEIPFGFTTKTKQNILN